MPDVDDYIDDEPTTQTANTQSKGLRAQYEQVLADKKQLEADLAKIQADHRTLLTSSHLRARGVRESIAKYIHADVTTAEQIDGWLRDNADDFGLTVNSDDPPQQDTSTTQQPAQRVDEATVQASQRIQNITGQASTPPTSLRDIEQRIANATTMKEVNEALAAAQKLVAS